LSVCSSSFRFDFYFWLYNFWANISCRLSKPIFQWNIREQHRIKSPHQIIDHSDFSHFVLYALVMNDTSFCLYFHAYCSSFVFLRNLKTIRSKLTHIYTTFRWSMSVKRIISRLFLNNFVRNVKRICLSLKFLLLGPRFFIRRKDCFWWCFFWDWLSLIFFIT